MKKAIYVAGPYRGRTHADVAENIRKAWTVGAMLLRAFEDKVNLFVPHNNTGHYDGLKQPECFLEDDLYWLSKCDALFAMTSFHKSDGAKAEIHFAQQNSIPVFYAVEDLGDWLENGNGIY